MSDSETPESVRTPESFTKEEDGRQKWEHREFMGAKWIVTIKGDLVPDQSVFYFADPKFIDKYFNQEGNVIFEIPKAWTDHCNHPVGSYVGSFECLSEKYDLYIFDDTNKHQKVCLRFGNEANEYLSVGRLVHLIELATRMECYRDALELVQKRGALRYVPYVEENAAGGQAC